jgi:hypothetical protein
MKKALAVFLLLVVLSAPAMAAPRDDDGRGRGGVVDRVVHFVKKIIGGVIPLDDSSVPVPRKPRTSGARPI